MAAQEGVDLELVLLADGSRSIDAAELRFQREGYATAMQDPAVLAAIGGGYYQRIAVAYVEWGGAHSQKLIVPWMAIDGPESAARFADTLLSSTDRAEGVNAIGTAIALAHELIETNAYDAARKVIDFSGDSANNMDGPPLAPARAQALAAGVTINGLAVLCYACSGPPVSYDLVSAFERSITGGPGSFVISADNTTRFTDAVRRKLILEIAGKPARTKAPAS
ncbi:DUF1194 domain-containing protein [Ferruginivarius sediminum]|uniref:DUF1194 domain-containing protein n=1 Tax=Ferruginivarius sediminum TaxID=2661937 RepID=UPI0019D4C4FC|nr:DUF1194 domain-containing protein [Ferruginivarius sediminum]